MGESLRFSHCWNIRCGNSVSNIGIDIVDDLGNEVLVGGSQCGTHADFNGVEFEQARREVKKIGS